MNDLCKLLDRVDLCLMAAGGLVLVVSLVHWYRHLKKWRDPLRGTPIRASRLTPLLLWFCVLVNLLGGLAGTELADWVTPGNLNEAALESWEGVLGAGVTQTMTIIVCLAVAHFTFTSGLKGLGIGKRPIFRDLFTGIAGCLAAICICGLILIVTGWIVEWFEYEPPVHSVYTTLTEPEVATWMRVFAIFGAIVLAPIGEELFFRGILQTGVKKLIPPRSGSMHHRWWSIVLVGSLFGVMHMVTPHHIPALIILGIILGYLYERTGSLTATIILHMLFNAKSILWYELKL
ncbi:MAG: lysostaphin resistance A-like protein [Planctomycetota bacterium]|jgi:membrane protease YdiL (CAAX protease family)